MITGPGRPAFGAHRLRGLRPAPQDGDDGGRATLIVLAWHGRVPRRRNRALGSGRWGPPGLVGACSHPAAVDFDASPEGHALGFDARGSLVGVTIVDARRLLNRDGEIKVPVLPTEPSPPRSGSGTYGSARSRPGKAARSAPTAAVRLAVSRSSGPRSRRCRWGRSPRRQSKRWRPVARARLRPTSVSRDRPRRAAPRARRGWPDRAPAPRGSLPSLVWTRVDLRHCGRSRCTIVVTSTTIPNLRRRPRDQAAEL